MRCSVFFSSLLVTGKLDEHVGHHVGIESAHVDTGLYGTELGRGKKASTRVRKDLRMLRRDSKS